jgi:adenine-specific DNA-methyltransferase
MKNNIRSWYLDKIDFDEAPDSLASLATNFACATIDSHTLRGVSKWEPLLRGLRRTQREGWTNLSLLASTRRGIATGSNDFFLLSVAKAKQLGLRSKSLIPCVGRAADVEGLIFTNDDLKELDSRGVKTQLVVFEGELTTAEERYVREGEKQGLPSRYLLKVRAPWYSMEKVKPAPIWAAVFGRGTLKFVHNAAQVRSLTNFHGVYPIKNDLHFVRALTFCLNSPIVTAGSATETRHYGGGLRKFEPNDLKAILVPDLRLVTQSTLEELSSMLTELDIQYRHGEINPDFKKRQDEMVIKAGEEAASHLSKGSTLP